MGVVTMIGAVNFILYVPLMLTAFMELSQVGKNMLDKNPNTPVLSLLKSYIVKGV